MPPAIHYSIDGSVRITNIMEPGCPPSRQCYMPMPGMPVLVDGVNPVDLDSCGGSEDSDSGTDDEKIMEHLRPDRADRASTK
jgi:hypothetical protein